MLLAPPARAQVVGELVRAQASETTPAIEGLDPASAAGVAFAAGWEAYADLRVGGAVPHWRRAVAQAEDATASRGLRAWLAEALRRTGQQSGDAALLAEAVEVARGVLAQAACHAHAHLALADALNPQYLDWPGAAPDETWHHLTRAVACDPGDGNAWTALWTEATARGDAPAADRALATLAQVGFWTPPVLAFARWTLRQAPPNAVLLTNGDADTVPMRIAQVAEGLRPDVLVVNVPLLDLPEVARRVAETEGLPLPDSVETFVPRYDARGSSDTAEGRVYSLRDAVVDHWVEASAGGSLGRPLVASITLDPGVLGNKTDVADLGAVLAPAATFRFDAGAARASFTDLDGAAFRGPLVHPSDRSPVRRAFPFDPGALVLFQMLQTAVTFAQDGQPEAADAVHARAIAFAQAAGRPDDPLIATAREWIEAAGEE